MSGFKGVLKDGWHPKSKEGKSESWRGDFKGINQVAGWMGKGKDGSSDSSERAPARPLSSLKDPSSFAPPPRRGTTPSSITTSTTSLPSRGREQEQEQEQEDAKPPPPPVPYRVNTTGLTTDHLPPPPVHRSTNTNREDGNTSTTKPPVKQKPSLPPRLPPRRDQSEQSSPPPPPAYEAVVSQNHVPQLNQGAMNRLANAGVSVPAFGINGGESNGGANSRSVASSPQNELQARFNQMKIGQSQSQSPPPVNSPSPTQQHYQPSTTQPTPALERTNTSSRDSLHSFKERHNDQIQAGKQKLQGINEKYGITKRINSFIDDQKSPANPTPRPAQPQHQRAPPPPPTHPYSAPSNNSSFDQGTLNKRKPPPPPPPKKREMQAPPVDRSSSASSSSPPPLPLSTKPR